MSVTVLNSASLSGLSSAQVARFSSTCSGVLMPESTIVTPGTLCKKRKAQETTLSSGLRALSVSTASAGRLTSRPPRTPSITQTGMPRSLSSATFSSACWRLQST